MNKNQSKCDLVIMKLINRWLHASSNKVNARRWI